MSAESVPIVNRARVWAPRVRYSAEERARIESKHEARVAEYEARVSAIIDEIKTAKTTDKSLDLRATMAQRTIFG